MGPVERSDADRGHHSGQRPRVVFLIIGVALTTLWIAGVTARATTPPTDSTSTTESATTSPGESTTTVPASTTPDESTTTTAATTTTVPEPPPANFELVPLCTDREDFDGGTRTFRVQNNSGAP